MIKSLLYIVLGLLVVGCGGAGSDPKSALAEQKQKEQMEMSRVLDNIPSNAVDVQKQGNGWFSYDLVIDGQKHTFLYNKNSRDSHE